MAYGGPMDVAEWLGMVVNQRYQIYAKKLSRNDTQATGAHQAGVYVPKRIIFATFPAVNAPSIENPDAQIRASIDSHGLPPTGCRVIWYNNILFDRTRDETRVTCWGGLGSPLQYPLNAGTIACFAFSANRIPECRVWLCRNAREAAFITHNVRLG